ncbi:hypothetical protein [Paenibacillus sp. FSL R7-0331]|uniref:hypothetical protein n=1 Tax=Paenibacillus sp. FSL R7-0331 TaxID=1536773 RepID=UPI0004F6D804|nr:hypothetical protein [Paenibacillus sp. FSL R7-0331]AIQ50564.1 hypothetical protein R70331_02750 [Paenibacillus sp. FSL R7-0331]
MNGTGIAVTAVYLGLTLLIIGVFVHRVRKETFRRHIMAEAAIVISFVVMTMLVNEVPLFIRLIGAAMVAAMFNHGRKKSSKSS